MFIILYYITFLVSLFPSHKVEIGRMTRRPVPNFIRPRASAFLSNIIAYELYLNNIYFTMQTGILIA